MTATPKAATPKAATPKAATPKAATPKAATPKADLTKSHLRVLGILAKAKGGLTRQKIAAAVVKMGVACYNGRISNESKTYATLLAKDLIREVELEVDGAKETAYEIKAKGKQAIEKAKAAK